MNLKRGHFIFILQICPLLVYGTINITSTGTQIIGEKLVLTCTLSLSSFAGAASWYQDGTFRSICTSTFCTVYTYGNYTTFTNGSNHINVTFDPVDSSIDGVWECTHALLGSDSFNVTAMNKTQSSGGTNTSTDNCDYKAIGILTGCLVIAFIIVIVMYAACRCCGCTCKTCGDCCSEFCEDCCSQFCEDCCSQFFENFCSKFFAEQSFTSSGRESSQTEQSFTSPGRESSQEGEGGPGFFKEKVLTLKSLCIFGCLVFYGVIVEVIVLPAVYYGYSKFQEELVIGVGFGIVLLLSGICLVVVWMLMKFVNNDQKDPDHRDHNDASETSRSQSCIRNGTVTPHETGKSQKKSTFDIRQPPEGHEGPQSTPKDPDARNLTTGRLLPPRPDIASPTTGPVDSVNSPRPNGLAPIENPNIPLSIDTLDEQKTDKKPKDKKKKKKKRKDEEQDNPAYVQDN